MIETLQQLIIPLGVLIISIIAWQALRSRSRKEPKCQHERVWLDSLYSHLEHESQTDFYVRLECSACPREWTRRVSNICAHDLALKPIPRYIDAKELR